MVKNANKATLEVISRYLRNDIVLVLDGYHPGAISVEQLQELGFTHLRIAPELYLQQETANAMSELRRKGFVLIGGNADTADSLAWLLSCGVFCASGTMTGLPVSEDELIRDSLAREK